jgi:hypothetical protein
VPHGSAAHPRADSRPFDESTRGPRGRGWTTRTVPTLPRPEQAEPASVPGEHGVRLDENERRPPSAPRLRPPRPEHPIRRGQTQPRGARAMQDRQLMPERADFEVQRRARTTCRPKRENRRNDDGDRDSCLWSMPSATPNDAPFTAFPLPGNKWKHWHHRARDCSDW